MSIDTWQVTISGIQVSVIRKDIKNLHLGVYPPNGRVRVAAPLALSDDVVRLAVIDRIGWIKRQQAQFAQQPRQSEREMVSGETHYYLGQRYCLRVVEHCGAGRVVLPNRSIMELHVRPETDAPQRRRVLHCWYRARLRELIPPLLTKWQAILSVQVADWRIKRMKTKWGACNVEARRIWMNLELAKKPFQCIEYIVVHELTHFLERHHNERFSALMDRHLPKWRAHRQELNAASLAHENWNV